MARYLNLQVPSSCKENWNDMVPDQGGRHCTSCQKTVVDFTRMTEQELIHYFSTFKGSACGRFTHSQLNRDIPVPRKPLAWVKYFFQFSLPAFLLSLKSAAQVQRISTPIEVLPVRSKAGTAASVPGTLPVRGVITDEEGNPLANASVFLKDSRRGTITDTAGRFLLYDVLVPATIVVSYVGYEPEEVNISSFTQATAVKLKPESVLMGDVVVVGGYIPKRVSRREEKKTRKQSEVSLPASIQAYPNPVISGNTLNVQCQNLEQGQYQAEWYTLAGQLVQAGKVAYGKKDSRISLPVGTVLPGTYVLRLIHEKSGKQFSQQVVVQQ